MIPPPSRLNSDVASPSRTQRNGVSPGANGINDKKDGTEVENPLEVSPPMSFCGIARSGVGVRWDKG